MKSQSQLVLALKTKIQTALKLIALKIKKYVIQLLDLETQLEEATKAQLNTISLRDAATKRTRVFYVSNGKLHCVAYCFDKFFLGQTDRVSIYEAPTAYNPITDAWEPAFNAPVNEATTFYQGFYRTIAKELNIA